ncbi:MAG TPA: vitamin K epoxide reductase family protein [Pyrinomonadaceae bacterium]|jgi:uncharacterized membrane protein
MSRPKKSKTPQTKAASKTAAKATPAEIAAEGSASTILFAAAALLALVGLGDSIYLTVEKLAGVLPQCSYGGCEEVLNGPYSTIGPVPVSALGVLAYFAAFSLATLAAFGKRKLGDLLFYLVALMLAVSIFLFILQAYVIGHFCQFCLISAAMTVLLALIVAAERFYFRRRQ